MLALLLGELPGADQPLKPEILRNHREVHQLHPASRNDRQETAANEGKHACACQRYPVVLQMKCFFYVVDFVLLIRRTWWILEVGEGHLNTHSHLPAPGSVPQPSENVVL